MKIDYTSRYSDTDKPDKMGRWTRIAHIKGLQIAWINRLDNGERVAFAAHCFFPCGIHRDNPNESKVCDSLEDAKGFISKRWDWFLNHVKK